MRRRVWTVGIGLIFLAVAFSLLVEQVGHPEDATPTQVVIAATSTPTLTPTSTATAMPLSPTLTPSITPTPTATLVIHTVQHGETTFKIAQAYQVPFPALQAVNGLTNPNQIMVGQMLIIPPPGITDVAGFVASLTPATATPLPPDVTPSATPTPQRLYFVNGMAVAKIIVISPKVEANIRKIYAKGQELGRNPHAFSRLGDSTIANPFFMTRFDTGPYNLGDYAYLQPAIDYYSGSFGRDNLSVKVGLHTWSVLDPMWAPKPICQAGEHMLACEFRVHNPSMIFIRMGSNDAGIPDVVDKNLRKIVDFCLENGVIPIMGTKADRFDGADNTNNKLIRQIAKEYDLPLWDFDAIAETIPGRGLGPDNVHLTSFYAHDWRSSVGFQTGHGVHSLTGLIVLDAMMGIVETLPVSTPTSAGALDQVNQSSTPAS